jgi:tetratricopeptide (TPR) repeat protein
MRKLIVGALVILASFCGACAWDYDTLSMEAKGLPTVIDAIVGRISVNPSEYYKKRIELSLLAIQSNPKDFAAYDNLAVAYDKLGNSEDAFRCLNLKLQALKDSGLKPTSDPLNDPWYRYHANLGTVYAHTWFRKGATQKTDLLDKAVSELEKAIAINPKAHFGREVIQIEVIKMVKSLRTTNMVPPTPVLDAWRAIVEKYGAEATAEGLIGMMALGGGAESRDMIGLLYFTIGHEDASLQVLTEMRNTELEKSGAPVLFDFPKVYGMPFHEEQLKKQFKALRENAKAFQANRTSFIQAKLKLGLHPDTDPSFWNDYQEVPRIEIGKMEPLSSKLGMPIGDVVILSAIAVFGIVFSYFLFKWIRHFFKRTT